MMIPGFAQRVQGDLAAMLPAGTVVRVVDVERDYARPGAYGGSLQRKSFKRKKYCVKKSSFSKVFFRWDFLKDARQGG